MKILQVIHGYPMRYNAGSEVYTQSLCQALANHHEVHVFTREEDPFAPDCSVRVEHDQDDPRVILHVVNLPNSRDRYRQMAIDQRFAELLESLRPDIVHVGHLNHLSTSLVAEAAAREIPVVYTLHDYWVMCPRGQFIQMHPEDPGEVWAVCDGQDDRKCAERCYARYFSGAAAERADDVAHWTDWVRRRMRHIHEMADLVDLFIAPSHYLLSRHKDAFGLPEAKLKFLDYGFDHARLGGRVRAAGEPFTFGYIGTHIPAKGIHHLIDAMGRLRGESQLRIWGRPRGQDTDALQRLAARLPDGASGRITWLPEYRNRDIVQDVFNRVDAIVVPSIWAENSPLVIHEAQQSRVPVITANFGGMAEYVRHEVNGLLFDHRNPASLAEQMQRLADDPVLAARLGQRGYLLSETGDVPDIGAHAAAVEALYGELIRRRDSARVRVLKGPWRVTLDTNPDTCNAHCVMCEGFSEFSPRQAERRAAGKPPRLMPVKVVRRVIADAAAHGAREIIPSTMGEPLLYEHFDEIIQLCATHGLKLNLTTNGTFPRRGAREWARRLVPITSDVKISWNGARKSTHETVMVGVRWEQVLENVKEFIAVRDEHAAGGGNRCRVTFQMTFLETNVGEVANIVRLAARLGVDRVKGHHLWAHFDQIKRLSMRRNQDSIRRWNAAVLEARSAAAERLLQNGKPVLLENFFLLDESATTDLAPGGPCPFLGQEAWVSAEGRFDPCCAPDELRRGLGEFGNLNEKGLHEIWTSDAYRGLAATYRNRPLCLSCNMRKPAEVQP